MTARARSTSRPLAALGAALALACSGGSGQPGPRPSAVAPDRGPEGAAVRIRIAGDGLAPHVLTDYGNGEDSFLDARFQATLGGARLRDVRPTGDGALDATVPEDLPAGTHDLVVTDPSGRSGSLPAAYRVVPATSSEYLVASYRIDPVADQVAFAPFAATVTALDAAGQVVTSFSGTIAIADRAGALRPTAIGPFAWGVWTGPLEVRRPISADALTVTDSLGHAGTSNDFAVAPVPAALVAFTSPPVSSLAGTCAGPVTVALEDLYGFATTATAPVAVSIDDGGALEVFSDPACAVAAAGATIAAGAGSAQVFVRSTAAGPFTLTASGGGLAPATQAGDFSPAAPARLVFTSGPQTVVAGTCSAPATMVLEDAYGNVSPVAADTAVALDVVPAGSVAFHAGAGCAGGATSSVTVAAGTSAASFSFTGIGAGSVAVTATAGGVPGAATQTETVTPAVRERLVLAAGSAQSVDASACSPAPVVLESRDAQGNPSGVGGATSIALSGPSGFTYFTDATCSTSAGTSLPLASGTSQVSFWFKGTAAGAATVTATVAGWTPVSIPETIVPAGRTQLVLVAGGSQTVDAGACSPAAVVLESRDAVGNVSGVGMDRNVVLSGPADLQYFTDASCTIPVVASTLPLPSGTTQVSFYFSGTTLQTATVAAAVAGWTPVSIPETIVPASRRQLALLSGGSQTVAASACSPAPVVLESRDASGNPSGVGAATSIALSGASGFTYFTDATCSTSAGTSLALPSGTSQVSFWFEGTTAGAAVVTATVAAWTPLWIPEAIVPATRTQLALVSGGSQTVDAGACSPAPVVLESRDAQGNASGMGAATSIALSGAAGFTYFTDAICSASAGTSLALASGTSQVSFWFKGATAGAAVVTSSVSGWTPVSIPETIVPAARSQLALVSGGSQTVAAGACSSAPVVLESRDASGNPSGVGVATSIALSGAAGFTYFTDGTCSTSAGTSLALPSGTSQVSFWFEGTMAGAATVTATVAAWTPLWIPEAIVPATRTQLALVSGGSQTVDAGACSPAPVVLESRDAQGNASGVGGATSIALTGAAGFTYFTDATCSTSSGTSVPLASGAFQVSFWFKGTAAGAATVTATVSGWTPVSIPETIVPATRTQLVLVAGGSQSVSAGVCSPVAVVLESRDAQGNASGVGAATSIALSGAAGFQYFTDSTCTTSAGASLSLATGTSQVSLWFMGTTAGATAVTATVSGWTPVSIPETIVPAVRTQLALVSGGTQTVAAGACSPLAVVLESRDAQGNASGVGGATSISLSGAAGFTYFTNATCTTSAGTSLALASGTSQVSFWFKGTTAGAATVAALVAGWTPVSIPETIVPAARTQLVLVSGGAQSIAAGACSPAPVVLESRDAEGNVSGVGPDRAVVFAGPADFQYFTDASCTIAVAASTLSLPTGTTQVSFHFKGATVQSATMTATVAGWAPVPIAGTIIPAARTQLILVSGDAQSVAAGACSPAPVVLESRDAEGNVSGVGPDRYVLLAGPADFQYFTDASCTIPVVAATLSLPSGTSQVSFHFKGTAEQSAAMTATVGGWTPVPIAGTILPAARTQLVLVSGDGQAVAAGACSGVVVLESRDAEGNVSGVGPDRDVSLAGPADFQFFSDASCSLPLVASTLSLPSGTSQVSFYFKGTAVQSAIMTATVATWTPVPIAGSIVPAARAQLVLVSGDAQSVVAGACSSAPVVLESRDAEGNVSGVGPDRAVVLAGAGDFQYFTDASCTVPAAASTLSLPTGTTQVSFHFKGTTVQSATMTATVAGWTPVPIAGTILPAARTQLALVSGGAQSVAAGACSDVMVLESRDAEGNVSGVGPDRTVVLAGPPDLQYFTDASCTVAVAASTLSLPSGTAQVSFYFRGTTVQSATMTATVAGWTPVPIAGTILPGVRTQLVLVSGDGQPVAAGACSSAPVVLESRDADGNASGVGPDRAAALAGPADFQFFTDASCTVPVAASTLSLPTGTTRVTFHFRGTAVQSATMTATVASWTPVSIDGAIIAAPPDALAFVTGPQTLATGVCSEAATVESRDPSGNVSAVAENTNVALSASPAGGFTFYSDAGCTTSATSVVLAAGQTTAAFWMKAVLGPVTVTAAVAGWTTPATQVESITPGPTDHFLVDPIATPQVRTAPFAVRVVAVDQYGNVTPSFAGPAVLTLTVPQPPNAGPATLACATGCTAGPTTGAFSGGTWTGTVSVDWTNLDPRKLGVAIHASGTGAFAAVAGDSAAFEVNGALRSPPTAVVTGSPLVIRAGESVLLDASGSYDYQTPAASLQVSWDFQGASTAAPAYPTPAAPWTAWDTTKTVSNTYGTAGTYAARLAVRNADGDVGYVSVRIEVLAATDPLCTVTTSADVDDGAANCTGSSGTDGQLSFAEALRVAPNNATIRFGGPMTISGAGAYMLSGRNITVVAPAGTVLDKKSLSISGGGLTFVGLEFANQTSRVSITNKANVTFQDCTFRNSAGIDDLGTLRLVSTRMSGCIGSCVTVTDTTGTDTLTVRHSAFEGAAGVTALDLASCKAGKLSLNSQSSVFAGFQTAVRFGGACNGYSHVQHNTFASNGTGISYQGGGTTHLLRNNVFTAHTTAAVVLGTAVFADRDRHLLFGNASDGGLAGDAGTLTGDPRYLFPAVGDYRVAPASPAVDSALDLGLFLLPQYPATTPRFLGAGPDRGGRESW